MSQRIKVAVVTGANKGVGFGIVRGLCKRFDGVVYLTSQDDRRGREAVAKLTIEGLGPKYHLLDTTKPKSVEKFRDHIKGKYYYGGIDILINDTTIAFKSYSNVPVGVQAEQTIFVNFFSLLKTCEILFPILVDGARVVNISSSAGHLSNIPSEALRKKFMDEELTISELSELMHEYIEAAKKGTHLKEWGNSSYVVSIVGVIALTKIQQRLFNKRNLKINTVHPGFACSTDMPSDRGPLTVEESARAPLFLALDADDSVRGQYVWYNNRVVSWDGVSPDSPEY